MTQHTFHLFIVRINVVERLCKLLFWLQFMNAPVLHVAMIKFPNDFSSYRKKPPHLKIVHVRINCFWPHQACINQSQVGSLRLRSSPAPMYATLMTFFYSTILPDCMWEPADVVQSTLSFSSCSQLCHNSCKPMFPHQPCFLFFTLVNEKTNKQSKKKKKNLQLAVLTKLQSIHFPMSESSLKLELYLSQTSSVNVK